MKMKCYSGIVFVIGVILAGSTFAQDFNVRNVSDHVLIVSSSGDGESQFGANQVALKSEKGLVVFNTFWSRNVAQAFKQAITDALHRQDFAYTVNMVDRLDMFGGNSAYEETRIIGQKTFLQKYKGEEDDVNAEIKQLIDMWKRKEGVSRERLKGYAEGSADAVNELSWANTCKRRAEDLEQGFSLVLPEITYDDTMTLNLGDINLKLIWFGKEGNYDGMTVAVIPEDKVAIIPSFIMHPQHLAPYPYGEFKALDVPRWIAVLEGVLEGENAVETVICGTEEVWPREQAQFYLEYMRKLWEAVRKADAEGRSLAEVQDQLSLQKDFAFVKDWSSYKERGDEWFLPQHVGHVKVWFLQGRNLASEMIKNGGPDSLQASLAKVRELRNNKGDIYFDEASINEIGYYLIGAGKLPEAIEVFKLNVEVFPESANAYDSLGEAYMKNGDKENAIENYKKSLALNPENENAKRMLNELNGN